MKDNNWFGRVDRFHFKWGRVITLLSIILLLFLGIEGSRYFNHCSEKLFISEPKEISGRYSIQVVKSKRVMELYRDGKIIGRFRTALGRSPVGQKHVEGDCKTPEGVFYICTRNEKSKYHLFLGLSYPNVQNAQEGLQAKIINQGDFAQIDKAISTKQQPPWNTPLGGAVGIHGGINFIDWTGGCIALSNKDMDILWKYASMGTEVRISP